MAFLLLSSAAASAADVSAEISTHETFVGVPVTIRVIVTNAAQHEPPQAPQVVDADVRGPDRSAQTQMDMISGRRTDTVTYTFQIIPKHAGKLKVQPIRVKLDGETRSIEVGEIIVSESETEDLLYVELNGARKTVYVGEALDVTLDIWLRPFSQGQYKMSATEMFRCIDGDNSAWGEFKEQLKDAQSLRVREALRRDSAGNDRAYFVLSVPRKVWAEQPGPLQAGDIRIVVNYPVRIGRNRDMFSMFEERMAVTQYRPISAMPTSQAVEVKALPDDGRPPFFAGAVGKYQIDVSAKPTQVRVGDPITLSIAVRGEGRLDTLSPPPLAQLPELTEHFRVPDEALAGEVDKGVKRFTQSVRARSADVREVPAIPFAFFDPQAEKYVIVRSDPIPIKVEASELASTALIGPSDNPSAAPTKLTDVGAGILAKYTGADALLGQQGFEPGVGSAAVAVAGPLTFALCWITQRRSQRMRTDLAYVRRRRAARAALRTIAGKRTLAETERTAILQTLRTPSGAAGGNVRQRATTESPVAARVAEAILGYVADRCNLPSGALTRNEAMDRLQARGVDSMLRQRVNELLVECEQAAYAGVAAADGERLTDEAAQCVEELESKWR